MIVQPFPSFFFHLVLWLLLTSCSSLLLRVFFPVYKTSSGKHYHLRLIYLLHLHLEIRAVPCLHETPFCRDLGIWTLFWFGNSSVSSMPYIQFLFVRPRLCRRLPSDSTSRWTPLPLANSSYCQVCSGLSPPSCNACRAHKA